MKRTLENSVVRGGNRPGAGRKRGTGRFGERTSPMRVPNSMHSKVSEFISSRGYSIPLYAAKVPAGTPIHSESYIEEMVDLPAWLVKSPQETFLIPVKGDSMIGARIQDGDTLVVDRTLEVRSGKIVVASVNGETTVKRLKRHKGKTYLMPENAKYKPIEIKANDEFEILGVVTNSVTRLI